MVSSKGFCCADRIVSGLLIANANEAVASRLPTRVEDNGDCGGVEVGPWKLRRSELRTARDYVSSTGNGVARACLAAPETALRVRVQQQREPGCVYF